MTSRQRIGLTGVGGAGGGGGPAPTGNLVWGPDFGNPPEMEVGVHLDMPALALTNNKTVGVQLTIPTLAVNYNAQSVGVHLSGTASGAPIVRSVDTAVTTANAGSITIPIANVQAGELLVLIVGNGSLGSQDYFTPSGWTDIRLQTSGGVGTQAAIESFMKVATGSETSVTASLVSGNNIGHIGTVLHIIGFDTSTTVDISAGQGGSAINPVAPSITTTVANCLKIACCAQANSTATSYTPPTGYAEQSDLTATSTGIPQVTGEVATRVQAATGASGTATMTSTQLAASNYASLHIAIRPGTITLA